MNRLLLYCFFVSISLPIFTKSVGQSTFQIKPGAREIGRQDVLQVEYAVKGSTNASNFVEPVFKGWKVLSGPSLSSQQISVNGKTESSVSYIYSIQPNIAGTLIIPSSTVEIDGKKLTCSPVSIKVKNTAHVAGANATTSNGLQLPGGFFKEDNLGEDEIDKTSILQPGETVASLIKNNIFVKVFTNKAECVTGEPILVTYKLFTRLHSQSKVAKQPAFNGCTVYEMTTDEQVPQIEKYKGKDYKTYILRKVQIFPLQTGPLTLDIASVDNEISLYKKNNTGYPDAITQNVTLSSEPLTLHVNALPEKNKPKDGNSTVGIFSIHTMVEKMTDTAGENNNLIINIFGVGNFQNINCPTVLWPTNSEHFDNTEKSDINKLTFPASGTKTFIIPFLAKQAGRLLIASIPLTYFDMNTRQYKTVYSDSVEVTVLPALKTRFDPAKMSQDITNHKYIWIVPFLAVLFGIYWLLNYGRKNKVQNNTKEQKIANTVIDKTPATDTAILSPVSPMVTPAEKLNELLLIEDDRLFFIQAKQFATEQFQKESDEAKKTEWEVSIQHCNEALYLPLTAISKEDLFSSFEKLIS
jgi:hypothetical protein